MTNFIIIGYIVGGIFCLLLFICLLMTPDFPEKMAADEERKRINRILESLSDEDGNISMDIRIIHEKEN